MIMLAQGVKEEDAIKALEKFHDSAEGRARMLEDFGFKLSLSSLRIRTLKGTFSFEGLGIDKENDELFQIKRQFLLVLRRSIHEKTGDISISVDNQGYPVLEPQNPLPRGCHLHLSVIAKVISEQGLPPSGELTTK